jgi:hypothetical protein
MPSVDNQLLVKTVYPVENKKVVFINQHPAKKDTQHNISQQQQNFTKVTLS